MKRICLFVAALALVGCTQQEGLPSDYDTLPGAGGVAPQSTDFDLAEELQIATSACISSEINGPSALNVLLSHGYTAYKEFGAVKYGKISPTREKGILTGGLRAVVVSDPNQKVSCKIEVPRSKGYTGMSVVAASFLAQGYQSAGGSSSAPRFAKDGVVFMLSGSHGQYEQLASLSISRIVSN